MNNFEFLYSKRRQSSALAANVAKPQRTKQAAQQPRDQTNAQQPSSEEQKPVHLERKFVIVK